MTELKIKYHPRKVNPELLFGICEPVVEKSAQMGVDIDKSLQALKAIGAKSLRLGFGFYASLLTPTELNPDGYHTYYEFCKKAKEMGIEIVFQGGLLFKPASFLEKYPQADQFTIPHRDITEGSDYMQMLEMYEQSYETIVKAFPDVMYWELDNEPNMDGVFHPIEWLIDKNKAFSVKERSEILTDMMYYASRGIHKANPHALVIMPGWAPAINNKPDATFKGIAEYMEAVYQNIQSGRWPSKNPDDFFQIACWHAYNWDEEGKYEDPAINFVEKNNMLYDIMKKYGDGDKKVIISEFGYSDYGSVSEDEKFTGYMTTAYRLAKEHMPYIETIHYFRLFEDAPAKAWGGEVEIYFGLFKEPENGMAPKARTYAFQKMAGGEGNLETVFK